MISIMIASSLFSGTGCRVVVARNALQHAYIAPTVSVNYSTPYQSSSALVYKISDPEKDALTRIVEKQTDALIGEVQTLRRERDAVYQRLESAIATTGDPSGQASSDPALNPRTAPLAAATVILQRNCIECHQGDKAKGGFSLAQNPTPAQLLALKPLVNEMIQSGKMPPKEKRQLTNDEKKIISDWSILSIKELKVAATSGPK